MNINEIVKILELEQELGISQKEEPSINLCELYDLRNKVKCYGNYENYSYNEWAELDAWGGKSDFSYTKVYCRTYYDINDNTVKHENTSWDMYGTITYTYDRTKDVLVDDYGTEVTGEYLKYYKACRQDVPYFKPISITGDLTIDSELNIYSGEELLVSLNELVKAKGNLNENGKGVLTALSVKISDLPIIYRNYLGYDDLESKNKFIK